MRMQASHPCLMSCRVVWCRASVRLKEGFPEQSTCSFISRTDEDGIGDPEPVGGEPGIGGGGAANERLGPEQLRAHELGLAGGAFRMLGARFCTLERLGRPNVKTLRPICSIKF